MNCKPRVLHLLKWLPRGGIETWLTHVWLRSANSAVQHEVLLMQDEIGPYENTVRSAGVVIHTLPKHNWLKWFADLRKFLVQEGPFDVFHVHVDSIVAGPALAVAKSVGIQVRIIHNHAARTMGADYSLRERIRERVGAALSMFASTKAIGISEMCIEQIAGARWRDRDDSTILLYGFDYSKFDGMEQRADKLREAYSITPDALVVGHIGRFDPVKNHSFLLETFALVAEQRNDAVLVLIGVGPLIDETRMLAQKLGISDRVVFAGGTDDVPAFLAMFDIFVFPSFSEGLGIVVLESQVAGTPVLMSQNIPREVVVIDEGVSLLPLEAGARAWADSTLEMLKRELPGRSAWRGRVEQSAFSMDRCVADLNAIYFTELARTAK